MVIEWAMIAGLGALAASFAWLMALPLVSRRAARRATERLLRQMPMSMAAINADKDALRADHAGAVRRLERAGEATQQRLAEVMGENGRYMTRIVTLDSEIDRVRDAIAALNTEHAATTRAMREAEATLGTQAVLLHEALGLAARRGDLLNTTEARLGLSDTLNEERRATIAALETRASGQDLRLGDALGHLAKVTGELATARAAMDETTGTLQIARADAALAAKERDALANRVHQLVVALTSLEADREEARGAVARAEQRLRIQASTIDGLSDRVMAQDTERDTLHRLLEEAHARRDALHAERTRLMAGLGEGPAADDSHAAPASEERTTRLRAAVATLAADLVTFATTREGSPRPEATPDAPV